MNTSGLSTTNLNPSPAQRMQESENAESANTRKYMNNIKSELQVNKHQKQINKELHEKRVQNLRKELEYLKTTEWKYQPVDRF